ncbi:transcriptional regulator [Streptomyces sp. Ru71]|uniref:winged helix-turn-helix transcriptional regulator n=1 Tax=Streptomyces sp. Ru71 TaxID=2080746 RepID=UPI000CDD1425|nr:helix-turn-helix domain-containing protein [Streptomyces sp. Ru71]POX56973.1 transcriptional regulator [Streptomyces sp. Ru71]
MTTTISAHEQHLPKRKFTQEGRRDDVLDDCPTDDCPARWVLEILTTKWTPIVLYLLHSQSPMRYGELRRAMPETSKKVLTETLRGLERDGLVLRVDYEEKLPRVDYYITELGEGLIPIIQSLKAWAEENIAEVLARRTLYGPAGRAASREGAVTTR